MDTSSDLKVCTECGAIIPATEDAGEWHLRWHENLDARIDRAESGGRTW